MQEKLLQRYSQQLAQSKHDNMILEIKIEETTKELIDFQTVINSDEGLQALFNEQKEKLLKGE